jgi:hypothetical protein
MRQHKQSQWPFSWGLAALGIGWCAALLAAADVSPDPRTLEIQPADIQRAKALVERLGDPNYWQREQAQAELARMGRLARPVLQEALAGHPNPEVRHRCATLIPAAIEDDLKARLAVFLADTQGRYHHHLPGWDHFRAVACNEWRWCGWLLHTHRQLLPAAQQLYADILRSSTNRELLFTLENPQAALAPIVAERRQQLFQNRIARNVIINGQLVTTITSAPATAADWLTLMLVEIWTPSTAVDPRVRSGAALLPSSPLASLLRQSDATGQVVRHITTQWCLSRQDPLELYQLLLHTTNLGLPQLAPALAQRLLRHPTAPAAYKRMALQQLLKDPNPRQLLPVLESLFRDHSVMTQIVQVRNVNGQQQREAIVIQLRDVALAVAVHLCGRSPQDYGFTDRFTQQPTNVNTASILDRYYFRDDMARQQAFERWQRERPQPPGS